MGRSGGDGTDGCCLWGSLWASTRLGEGVAAKIPPFQVGRDLTTTGGRLHCWSLPVGKCYRDALRKTVLCWQQQHAARPRRWALVNREVPMDLQRHRSNSALPWTSAWESKYSSPSPGARNRVKHFISICISVVYPWRRGNSKRRRTAAVWHLLKNTVYFRVYSWGSSRGAR